MSDQEIEILTTAEVAEMLGLNPKTVYDAVKRGEIPHRRVGRRVLFERRSIVDSLRNPSVTPTRLRKG